MQQFNNILSIYRYKVLVYTTNLQPHATDTHSCMEFNSEPIAPFVAVVQ